MFQCYQHLKPTKAAPANERLCNASFHVPLLLIYEMERLGAAAGSLQNFPCISPNLGFELSLSDIDDLSERHPLF